MLRLDPLNVSSARDPGIAASDGCIENQSALPILFFIVAMSVYVDPPPGLITNARAPSSLPRAIATPLSLISTIAYVAVLAPYLAYQTFIYYTIGPPWPGWTLGTLLFTRGLGMLLRFMFRFGLPQADSKAWGVPIGAKRKGVGVECRRIQGLPKQEEDELRVGWAKQKDVKVVDVPGFMLYPEPGNSPSHAHQPSNVTGSGYARANKGEKIVYYLVGGGYIGGHPLRTHLAWTTSQQLNVRVFGTLRVSCPLHSLICGAAVNYRKSLTAETAFPACLLDALSGYIFLTRDLGFSPSVRPRPFGLFPSLIPLAGHHPDGRFGWRQSRARTGAILGGTCGEVETEGDPGDWAGRRHDLVFGERILLLICRILISLQPWCDMTFSFPSCKDNIKSASQASAHLIMRTNTPLQD